MREGVKIASIAALDGLPLPQNLVLYEELRFCGLAQIVLIFGYGWKWKGWACLFLNPSIFIVWGVASCQGQAASRRQ